MAGEKQTPAQEQKEQAPEKTEITKQEAEAIIKGINDAHNTMREYDLTRIIEKQDGSFVYKIDISGKGTMKVTKYERGFFVEDGKEINAPGENRELSTLYVVYQRDIRGHFALKMLHQEPALGELESPDPEKKRVAEVAEAKLQDGVFTERNGGLLKQKADKFLKIVNDYIEHNKPETSGPKEVRDF